MTREDQHMDHLRAYVRERLTPRQFAQRAGVSYNMALLILNGQRWTSTRRPEGFVYPWPERGHAGHRGSIEQRMVRYAEGVERFESEAWDMKQLAEHLKVSKSSAHRILRSVRVRRASEGKDHAHL
jgi:transcriptional regulator with XRE-family HTH domain